MSSLTSRLIPILISILFKFYVDVLVVAVIVFSAIMTVHVVQSVAELLKALKYVQIKCLKLPYRLRPNQPAGQITLPKCTAFVTE